MTNKATHDFVRRDCAIYDTLHPAIKKVIQEAPISVPIQVMMAHNQNLLRLAEQNPYGFALKLQKFLVEESRRAHRILPAELEKAMGR